MSRFSPVAWKRFDPTDPWTKLALDAIADRFGVGAVRPADVLDTDRGTLRDEVLRREK